MNRQVFVKVNEYQEIVKLMDMIKSKLRDAKASLDNIRELKNDEDSELELWTANLQEIDERISAVDKAFSGPEGDEV